MTIKANIPNPIPINFLLDFLFTSGFASMYSTGFSSMPTSFTILPVLPLCLSRYSLSYLSKPLSFLSTPDGSGCVVCVSGFVIRKPQLLQKLFSPEL